MAMVGHKTSRSTAATAIVDAKVLAEATQKLDAYRIEETAKAKAERKGQLAWFRRRANS